METRLKDLGAEILINQNKRMETGEYKRRKKEHVGNRNTERVAGSKQHD